MQSRYGTLLLENHLPAAAAGCRLSSFGLPIDRLLAARTRNGHDRHPRERCQVAAVAAEFAGFTPPPSVGIVGNGPRLPGQLGRWRMSRQGARVVAHPAATPDGPKAVDVRRPRVQAHALVWKLEGRDMRLRISRVVGLGTRLGAFALVVGLAACGGGNDPAPSAAEGMAAESAALGRMQALAAASTQQASTAVIANPTAADLFEWAQWKWPALFPAGPIQVEKELGGIHYAIRAYATGIFLAVGTSTGDVYALLPRPENPLVALGNLANFAAEISADSCTFRPGSCDPPGGLYLGYYAEDVADNPEDPTMGAFTMNLPSGEGAYAGSMFFTYVGCQTSNVGTVSGTKAGQAIGGTWTGTLDGLPQSGGYSAEYSESNDSYVGTYTVAAGKQFRNLLPCIQYYIASKGAIEMFPTGASDPATFAVSISGRTIEWSVVSGGVMALVYIIDPTVAETNGNPVLWQTLAAAPRLSMVISESITLQTGHEYLAVVSVANANNQRVAFGSQRFVAL